MGAAHYRGSSSGTAYSAESVLQPLVPLIFSVVLNTNCPQFYINDFALRHSVMRSSATHPSPTALLIQLHADMGRDLALRHHRCRTAISGSICIPVEAAHEND